MTFLLMLLLLFNSPLRDVEYVKLTLPSPQQEIFVNYSNDNFSQRVTSGRGVLGADIKSSNYLHLNLNFRVFPQTRFLNNLAPELREVVKGFFQDGQSLKSYLTNVSFFLRGYIRYSEEPLPQEPVAVILNQKANCVCFSNLIKVFLDAAGIENRQVKGFYLQEEKKNILLPVPHRWVEIVLPNGTKFFYDPQYQRFSAAYIVTRDDVDFKRVRKFKVTVIKKSKKIVN
jgi:transglutaminase-like putative cysteine protease